jgi:hypothetical protein
MKKLSLACVLLVITTYSKADFSLKKIIDNPVVKTLSPIVLPQEFTWRSLLNASAFAGLTRFYFSDYDSFLVRYIELWPLSVVLTNAAVLASHKDPRKPPFSIFIVLAIYVHYFDELKNKLGLEQASAVFGLLLNSLFLSGYHANKQLTPLQTQKT